MIFQFISIYFPCMLKSIHLSSITTLQFSSFETIIYILFFKLNYTCDCCVFSFIMQEKLYLYFSFVSLNISFVNIIFYHECFIFFIFFLESTIHFGQSFIFRHSSTVCGSWSLSFLMMSVATWNANILSMMMSLWFLVPPVWLIEISSTLDIDIWSICVSSRVNCLPS